LEKSPRLTGEGGRGMEVRSMGSGNHRTIDDEIHD
jgi:hypothetical protein